MSEEKRPNEPKKPKKERTNKYKTHVQPNLDAVAAWARSGIIDKDIADALDVAYSTFRTYVTAHQELKEALKPNKNIADAKVENSFYKSTQGFFVKEQKGFRCKEVYYDDQGRRCEKEHVELAEESKFIAPQPGLILAWMFNRKPDVWKNKQIVRAVISDLSKYLDEVKGEEY